MCDALWTKVGQGESGLGSRITVGSLSSSRLTTYREQMTHILPLICLINLIEQIASQRAQTGSCHFFTACILSTVNNASLKKVKVERSKESGQVLVIVNSIVWTLVLLSLC